VHRVLHDAKVPSHFIRHGETARRVAVEQAIGAYLNGETKDGGASTMSETEELVPLNVIADMWLFHFGDDWVDEDRVKDDEFFHDYLHQLFSKGFLDKQILFKRFLETDVYRIKPHAHSR
jgi:hypothetical protein